MANIEAMPISTLPEAETLETDDQIIAYREDDGQAYRSNVGALSSASAGNISDAFSESKDYVAGDYCIYNDTLYRFTADHGGEWTGDDVEKTTVGTELESVNADLTDIEWVEIPLTGSFSQYSTANSNAVVCAKIGKLVFLRGVVTPTETIAATSAMQVFGTLPEGYLPAYPSYAICGGSHVNRWLLTVEESGNFGASRYGTTSNIDIPEGAWMPFYIVFIAS